LSQSTDVYNAIVDIVNNYKYTLKENKNNRVYLMPLKLDSVMGIKKQIQLTDGIDLVFVRNGRTLEANLRVNEITICSMSKTGVGRLPAEMKNDPKLFNRLIKSIDRDWTDILVELHELLIEAV
jgi:hypothetical protein